MLALKEQRRLDSALLVLNHDWDTSRKNSFRASLADEDARKQLDEAVQRGWIELARRAVRVGVLTASDVVMSAAAWMAVLWLFFGRGVLADLHALHPFVATLLVLPLAIGACGAYAGGRRRVDPGRVARGMVAATLLAWAHAKLSSQSPGVWVFVSFGLIGSLFVLSARIVIDRAVLLMHSNGIGARRLLVIGSEEDAVRIKDSLAASKAHDIQLVGRLSTSRRADDGALGTLADLPSALRTASATGVLIACNIDVESFRELSARCFGLGASVAMAPAALHLAPGVEVQHGRGATVLHLRAPGYALPQLALKRGLDVIACAVGLFLIAPLLALIAVAIKLDSKGPIFFKQERAGVGGRPFMMFKFRTMIANADELKARLAHLNESGDPRLFKIKNDPRITRVGRWLRKTSLDELPQLFNVLRGEMSLVGPRPFFVKDLEQYEDHHFERLSVLPGITGLWQVTGRSDVVDFEEVVRLDSAYIREWSIVRDLTILLRTVPAAFGRGAY